MVLQACWQHEGPALRFKRDGAWIDLEYAALGDTVREIARGLIALGVGRGDRVAILSATRAEWTLADLGAVCAGATVVPIYHTNSELECRHVLVDSGARVVICEDAAQLRKIEEVRLQCPALEHVLTFDGEGGRKPLPELRELGAKLDPSIVDDLARQIQPDDLATIVYTSGTSGAPKGCMLTHRNWMTTARMYESEVDLTPPVLIYLYLPLAHVLARLTQMIALDVGGTLAYWQGDSTRILDEVAELAPSHLPSVPRLFEKIHARALERLEASGRLRRMLFRWALERGRQKRLREHDSRAAGVLLRVQHRLADRLVLSKVRSLFGARLRQALSGAAPISGEVLEFFDACGVLILEGYGMTESTAAATLNTVDRHRFGSVGRPLPGTDVMTADDGEILMRGENVFRGYWNNEPATSEALAGGWLRSGDIGSLDEDGFLTISGRKKEIIITSSGKNIAPLNIETALRERPWVSQAVVYGDRHPYLVALLTLDAEAAPDLALRLGVVPELRAMAEDERVRAELQGAVDAVNVQFAAIEQVKRFAILDHDLTQEAGELTPTLKVKRAVVYDRYREIFEGLYR